MLGRWRTAFVKPRQLFLRHPATLLLDQAYGTPATVWWYMVYHGYPCTLNREQLSARGERGYMLRDYRVVFAEHSPAMSCYAERRL